MSRNRGSRRNAYGISGTCSAQGIQDVYISAHLFGPVVVRHSDIHDPDGDLCLTYEYLSQGVLGNPLSYFLHLYNRVVLLTLLIPECVVHVHG